MKNLMILGLLISLGGLISCKSAYEKQGDEHLNSGRPQRALQRYTYVIKKGNGSPEFMDNLTLAYIGTLTKTNAGDPNIDGLSTFKDKIISQINTGVKEETALEYGKAALGIATSLISAGGFDNEDWGFKFLEDASKYGPTSSKEAIENIKSNFIKKYIAEAQEALESAVGEENDDGIIADYTLSKLTLFLDATEEVKALWSKIRKQNLSTYLMYDLQGLIEKPLPKINKYGVLLAVRKITRKGSKVTVQVQAYNGSTAPFMFDGSQFTLKDKAGTIHKVKSKRGSFNTKKEVALGEQTKVGEIVFKIEKGVELASIHFKTGAGETVKFLP